MFTCVYCVHWYTHSIVGWESLISVHMWSVLPIMWKDSSGLPLCFAYCKQSKSWSWKRPGNEATESVTTHTSLKQLWWLPLLFFPSPVSPPYSPPYTPPSPSFLTGSRSFALCVSPRRGKYCMLLFLCKAPKAVSWHQCYASKRKEAIHTSWSLDLWCARNELVASALLPQGRKLLFSFLLLLMVWLSTAISTALWRQGGPLEYWSNAVQSDCGTVRILCSKYCYDIQYTCCSVECFHVSFPVATPRHSTHP